MKLTFDYVLPAITAENETLQVSEHGVVDLDDTTMKFCIGEIEDLKERPVIVGGSLYRIASLEYGVDGKVSDGTILSENAVGILYLEDFEEDEASQEPEGSSGWIYFVVILLVAAGAMYYYTNN